MIPAPAGAQIWVACGATDMRRGFDGLAMMVQDVLKRSPYCGHLFVFRGKRADRIKVLWWDGTGLCLYAKRLERGRFVWPLTQEGAVVLTPAQLSMLCEGIDGRSTCATCSHASPRTRSTGPMTCFLGPGKPSQINRQHEGRMFRA